MFDTRIVLRSAQPWNDEDFWALADALVDQERAGVITDATLAGGLAAPHTVEIEYLVAAQDAASAIGLAQQAVHEACLAAAQTWYVVDSRATAQKLVAA